MEPIIKWAKILAIILAIIGGVLYAQSGKNIVSGAIVGVILGIFAGGGIGAILGILIIIAGPLLRFFKKVLGVGLLILIGYNCRSNNCVGILCRIWLTKTH
jgi:hypothetical protein